VLPDGSLHSPLPRSLDYWLCANSIYVGVLLDSRRSASVQVRLRVVSNFCELGFLPAFRQSRRDEKARSIVKLKPGEAP
jgi:hypothetical protein